jgi:hypothetical protein
VSPHLPPSLLDLWTLLLLAAAVLIGAYFRVETLVSPKAPGFVGWVVRVAVGVFAWNLLHQLPVLIHVRL